MKGILEGILEEDSEWDLKRILEGILEGNSKWNFNSRAWHWSVYKLVPSSKKDKIKVQAAYFWLIKNEFIGILQIIKVEHFEYFSTYTQKEPGLQNRNFPCSKKRTSLKIRELKTGCISLNSFLRGKERENSLLQSWKEYWIVGNLSYQ